MFQTAKKNIYCSMDKQYIKRVQKGKKMSVDNVAMGVHGSLDKVRNNFSIVQRTKTKKIKKRFLGMSYDTLRAPICIKFMGDNYFLYPFNSKEPIKRLRGLKSFKKNKIAIQFTARVLMNWGDKPSFNLPCKRVVTMAVKSQWAQQ